MLLAVLMRCHSKRILLMQSSLSSCFIIWRIFKERSLNGRASFHRMASSSFPRWEQIANQSITRLKMRLVDCLANLRPLDSVRLSILRTLKNNYCGSSQLTRDSHTRGNSSTQHRNHMWTHSIRSGTSSNRHQQTPNGKK